MWSNPAGFSLFEIFPAQVLEINQSIITAVVLDTVSLWNAFLCFCIVGVIRCISFGVLHTNIPALERAGVSRTGLACWIWLLAASYAKTKLNISCYRQSLASVMFALGFGRSPACHYGCNVVTGFNLLPMSHWNFQAAQWNLKM